MRFNYNFAENKKVVSFSRQCIGKALAKWYDTLLTITEVTMAA